MRVRVCAEIRENLGMVPQVPSALLLRQGFSLAGNLLSKLHWLASKAQGFTCL